MFFDRLKNLCDKKGVSAYKACTDIGLNRAAVAKWKNGSMPSGSTAAKLADYFGVTTDYLLTGLPANVYECPDDENPWEAELLDAFDGLCLDDQMEAVAQVQMIARGETKKAPTETGERTVSDEDIKFALFGGSGEITDAMYREVKEFAALVKLREEMKKSKE